MSKKKAQKPETEPADITVDKSETLARADEPKLLYMCNGCRTPVEPTEHVSVGGRIYHAECALKDAPVARQAGPRVNCPTCGTAKADNRCDVCGHQEHDT